MIPYSRLNSPIYTPYPRVNSLKIIPFTAAHTYVPLYGSTPPPPLPPGSKVTLTFYPESNSASKNTTQLQ